MSGRILPRRQMTDDHRAYASRKTRGRPMISVTLSAETLKKLDAYCKRHKVSRGDAIGALLKG